MPAQFTANTYTFRSIKHDKLVLAHFSYASLSVALCTSNY